jgi:hypothetical protein
MKRRRESEEGDLIRATQSKKKKKKERSTHSEIIITFSLSLS